jgi:hypothetical protein
MGIKENASRTDTWIRALFMVIYGVIFYILCGIIGLLVLIQFIAKVITGKLIDDLSEFSPRLTDYALQILIFLTFQSDNKPWPFTSTPAIDDGPGDSAEATGAGAIEDKEDKKDEST